MAALAYYGGVCVIKAFGNEAIVPAGLAYPCALFFRCPFRSGMLEGAVFGMIRCLDSRQGWLSLLALAAGLVSLACDTDEQDPETATPATEAACSAPRSSPTPRGSWGPPSPWSAHTYTYCGTVTIDGQPAPDGSRIRFGVSPLHGAYLIACGDTTTLDGRYQVSFLIDWNWQTGCDSYAMYIRVAGRWANELANPDNDGPVKRLDLTVTNPPLFFGPEANSSDDPRISFNGPFCDQTGKPQGHVTELRDPNATLIRAMDIVGIAGVTVRVPELGLVGVTDQEGCFELPGLDISEPRLITMEATKEGYGRAINKNKVVRAGRSLGGFQLRRGSTLVVNDDCAFGGGPPLSAGGGEDAALCRKFGQGPQWFLSNCPVHALRQAHTPEGSLVGITGATVRADTKEPVLGATVSLVEDSLTVTTDERGCFGFSPLLLSSTFRLITLEVAASGFRPLTMKNLILESNMGMDVQLEAGSEPSTIDHCAFDSSPPAPEDETRFRHCQLAGAQP